ncbi:MAG: universal stress protein [Kofleriaceae bacterium]
MRLAKTILIPTDFSAHADAALDYAVALASKLDATVHVMNVVAPQLIGTEFGFPMTTSMMQELVQRQQDKLDQLIAARTGEASFGPGLLETGDPRQQIEQVALRIGADLIVMGTYGRRGVLRLLMGSVAEAVARIAPCPVLLIRDGVS